MQVGDQILILPSVALSQLKLSSLAGTYATIVEIRGTRDDIKGCWVKLPQPYLEEIEWYIPYMSIGI